MFLSEFVSYNDYLLFKFLLISQIIFVVVISNEVTFKFSICEFQRFVVFLYADIFPS